MGAPLSRALSGADAAGGAIDRSHEVKMLCKSAVSPIDGSGPGQRSFAKIIQILTQDSRRGAAGRPSAGCKNGKILPRRSRWGKILPPSVAPAVPPKRECCSAVSTTAAFDAATDEERTSAVLSTARCGKCDASLHRFPFRPIGTASQRKMREGFRSYPPSPWLFAGMSLPVFPRSSLSVRIARPVPDLPRPAAGRGPLPPSDNR